MSKKRDVWQTNFASVKSINDKVKEFYLPKMLELRTGRLELEEEWMRYFKMWNVTHDGYHGYNGRAKLYVPEVRKNVESQARQLTEAAFPNDDNFDCSPGDGGTPKGALIQKSIRTWQINQAQLRIKYHVFARQQAMLGTSPVYVPWNRQVERIFRSAKDPKTGKIRPLMKEVEQFNGPDFVVRDLFKWYKLDPRQKDIAKSGTAEYYTAKLSELKAKAKLGDLWKPDEILKGASDAFVQEQLQRDVERAEAMGLQIQNMGYAGEATLRQDEEEIARGTQLVCVIFDRMIAPEMCESDEDPDHPIPVQIEIYNNHHVGLVKRNPFFHQRPPYVVGHYIQPNADEAYAQGLVKAIQYMQYELNSTAEQTMDSKTLALNPIVIADPALSSQANDFQSEPGAVWFVNPQGIKFASVPDLTQTGYQAISHLRSQMQEYSDRSPALPPQLMGKSRSATQSEIVFDSLNTDNKAFQLQNEIEVLNPLMEMWESLTDQNITEDQVIMLLGRRSSDWKRALVTKNQTLGNYRYFWKAASQLKNRQVTARQVIDMMKIVGTLPPQVQSSVQFNFQEGLKLLWTELFQLPDADKILGLPEEMQSQDPEVEHKMLDLGMEIQVLPGDQDVQHMQAHEPEIKKLKAEKKTDQLKELIKHQLGHREQLQAKVQAAQRQQQMQQQAMLQAMQQAQDDAGGGGGGAQGSGNRTQLSPNSNAGDMASGVRA